MSRCWREASTSERPRERLLEKGAEALTEQELVALVLGSGGPRGSAHDLADRLLARAAGARGLSRASVREIASEPGVGLAKAATIVAAFELGRRAVERRIEERSVFRSSEQVFAHFRVRAAPLRQEIFSVLLLDAKHRKLREVRVSEGSLTAAIVHPREVFAPAVRESAAAVILVHNHPSGDPAPSAEDVAITRRLREVGEVLGIRVLDHVIVGADRHYSFVDAGCW